jgi:pyrroline-5-carboxylate reductase
VTSIGFIGGGKMAEAIIKGILSSKAVAASDIHVSDIDVERRDHLLRTYAVSAQADNQKVVDLSEVVVLAVKPQVLPEVIKGLKVAKNKLLVSIAAGITVGFLEKALPGVPVVRTMPNNPALVGAGITAIASGKLVTRGSLLIIKDIFAAIGEVVMVEEKNMDAVTGLSGSGPAYVYLMIEALTEAGKKLGIDQKSAEKLAVETVLGAAKTMKETGKSAQELREMVTSPGGTTEEGLRVLKEKKFAETLVEAVKAAAEKSKKLSR